MNIQHILWTDLVASPRNVRRVKADIAPLAISLAADGLIHNLVVTPREDGKYEVIAGERRRRAIVQLVKAGTWERDVQIACEVRDSEHATAISYAENAQRVAMHPADAIRAFATLSAEVMTRPRLPTATASTHARFARCWRWQASARRCSMLLQPTA